MATLIENAAEVATLSSAIDTAIANKGGSTAGGLRNAAAGIATIPTGVGFDDFFTTGDSSKGHITDGLIFHLDGTVQGDDVWVDQVGGMEFPLDYGAFTSNGYQTVTRTGGIVSVMSEEIVSAIASGAWTIELVVNRFLSSAGANTNYALGLGGTSFVVNMNLSGSQQSWSVTGGGSGFSVCRNNTNRFAGTLSFATSGMRFRSVSRSNYASFGVNEPANGVCVNTQVQAYTARSVSGNMCVGNAVQGGSSGFFESAVIHDIRIYNKMLSADEVRQNMAYDRAHYSLG